MFLYDITKEINQSNPIFDVYPTLTTLSHSCNDPHWSFPYHVHKEETELIYFSKGKANYQINTEVFHVQKGDLLIVNKGCIHSVTSSNTEPISCWTCSIKDFKLHNQNDLFLPMNKKPFQKSGVHEPIISSIFKELEYFSKEKADDSITTCNILSTALATIYFNLYKDAQIDSIVKSTSFVQDILIYINENYSQKITIKSLSEHFHMSEDHISHKFKLVYGISPINYVIERRISDAKWRLINTKDSLVSISIQVGYENTTHFSNLFLKRVGCPPLDYREKYGASTTNVLY